VREAFELCAAGIVGAALLSACATSADDQARAHRQPVAALRDAPPAGLHGHRAHATWGKDRRGDFEPLVSEHTFARAQAQLSRSTPRGPLPKEMRQHARDRDDVFPLRRFATCTVCGRAITGSESRSRNGSRYAFYHCTRGCVRVSKAVLEARFVELLEQLRPHPAYWKLVRTAVLDAWRAATKHAREARDVARRRLYDLEQKLARLEDAFIYRHAIDEQTYRAQRDTLREAIAIETMHVNDASDETLDVEAMLAFAEDTLQHASRLWTAETCTARRIQLQWALLPAGIRCRENGVIEPPVTYSDFFQLQPLTGMKKRLVDHPAPSWNRRSLDWLTTLYQWKAA
jgi:hypothetical protein